MVAIIVPPPIISLLKGEDPNGESLGTGNLYAHG